MRKVSSRKIKEELWKDFREAVLESSREAQAMIKSIFGDAFLEGFLEGFLE
jgi:hypothetical protein